MTAALVRSPSTSSTTPCANEDSSPARYAAAFAMASGVPFIMVSAGWTSPGAGVCTTPGEMAFTRTPCGPNSAAQAR